MYCPKCGKENPNDAQVCSSCSSVLLRASVGSETITPKTSGLAIAAFVLGILSPCIGVTIIPAIILGIVAIVTIEKSGGRLTGRVFAVLGIVIPVVVFFLIFVLMIALMPALNRVKEQARTIACMAQLRQWGLVLKFYTDDNDGYFFGDKRDNVGSWWMDPLRPYYQDNENLLLCPDAVKPYAEGGQNPFGAWKVGDDSGSYGMNGWVCSPPDGKTELWGRGPAENYLRTPNVKRAGNIPLLLDAMWHEGWPRHTDEPPPGEDWLTDRVSETQMKTNENEMRRFCVDRHIGYVNSLFMDWSVRKVGLKELWTLKWHKNYNTSGPWTRDGGCKPNDWPEWMRNFKDY
ncbi:MAG: zinc-ribbon domain-containing protein [Planctomycetota bacterium]|jgi:hypothetical protein